MRATTAMGNLNIFSKFHRTVKTNCRWAANNLCFSGLLTTLGHGYQRCISGVLLVKRKKPRVMAGSMQVCIIRIMYNIRIVENDRNGRQLSRVINDVRLWRNDRDTGRNDSEREFTSWFNLVD